MTGRIRLGGYTYVTATVGAAELGDDINATLIRDWSRRHLITGVSMGGRRWYRLDHLQAVELATFGRSRPRQAHGA